MYFHTLVSHLPKSAKLATVCLYAPTSHLPVNYLYESDCVSYLCDILCYSGSWCHTKLQLRTLVSLNIRNQILPFSHTHKREQEFISLIYLHANFCHPDFPNSPA